MTSRCCRTTLGSSRLTFRHIARCLAMGRKVIFLHAIHSCPFSLGVIHIYFFVEQPLGQPCEFQGPGTTKHPLSNKYVIQADTGGCDITDTCTGPMCDCVSGGVNETGEYSDRRWDSFFAPGCRQTKASSAAGSMMAAMPHEGRRKWRAMLMAGKSVASRAERPCWQTDVST